MHWFFAGSVEFWLLAVCLSWGCSSIGASVFELVLLVWLSSGATLFVWWVYRDM